MATTEMENVECISASYDIVDEDLQSLVSSSPYLMSALDPGKFNILQIANVKYVKFQTFVTSILLLLLLGDLLVPLLL